MTIKDEALKLFPPFDDTGENSLMRQATLEAYEACAKGEAVQALVETIKQAIEQLEMDYTYTPLIRKLKSQLEAWEKANK